MIPRTPIPAKASPSKSVLHGLPGGWRCWLAQAPRTPGPGQHFYTGQFQELSAASTPYSDSTQVPLHSPGFRQAGQHLLSKYCA